MKFSLFMRHNFLNLSNVESRISPEAKCAAQCNRSRGLSLCMSRGLLVTLILVKAFLMAAWLSREQLQFEFECRNMPHLDDDDHLQQPLVMLRRNDGNSLWYSDEDFIPQRTPRHLMMSSDHRSSVFDIGMFARGRRSTKPDTAETFDVLNERRLPPGRRLRIVKIVRRPLSAGRIASDDDEELHKRHWREVSVKADEAFVGSTIMPAAIGMPDTAEQQRRVKTVVRIVPLRKLDDENDDKSVASDKDSREFLQTRTSQNKLLRRIKVTKRRRKSKIAEKDGPLHFLDVSEIQQNSRDSESSSGMTRPGLDRRTTKTTQPETQAPVKATESIVAQLEKSNDQPNQRSSESAQSDVSREREMPLEQARESRSSIRPSLLPLAVAPLHEQKNTTSNFIVQFNVFKRDALCVTRTLLDAWCGVQLVALVLFILGASACCNGHVIKYFLMPHLILDSLLLLALFVFALTTAAFGALLFALVKEMTFAQFTPWLSFGGLLLTVFAAYGVAFIFTLRCTESIVRGQHQTRNFLKCETAAMAGAPCACHNCRIYGDGTASYEAADHYSQRQPLFVQAADV